MRTGRPKAALVLSTEQRAELESWARRRNTAQALASRARIILACADGGNNKAVAGRLGLSRLTVGRWRARFIGSGVDGLLDEPRPGAPRKISDAAVEKAVTLTLESKPRDATHWSTRSLAKRVGLSRSSVARIWRAFGLRPPTRGASHHGPGLSREDLSDLVLARADDHGAGRGVPQVAREDTAPGVGAGDRVRPGWGGDASPTVLLVHEADHLGTASRSAASASGEKSVA